MDRAEGSSQHPGQSGSVEEHCPACAIALWAASRSKRRAAPFVAEDVAEDVVVLSAPELDGLAVLPCQHVGGLEELSDLHRAHVLAALRRARQRVRAGKPGSTPRVVVMSEPPAAEGHLCFQVLASEAEDQAGAESPEDTARHINR